MALSLFRSIANQYQNLRSINSVPMMNVISHQIEMQVINHRLPVNFYAGFQRYSLFPDQLRLYGRLGSVARRVYVLGVPDVRPPSIAGIEFIDLEHSSPLSHEWFVLVDTPDFWSVLLTQEVEGRDLATGGRQFDGIWSFDAQVVDRASLLMSQVMGTDYQPVEQRNYEKQNMHIAEISSNMIQRLEHAEIGRRRSWAQTHTLQALVEATTKTADKAKFIQNAAQILHTTFGANSVVITLAGLDNQYSIAAAEGDATMSGAVNPDENTPSNRAIHEAALITVSEMRKSREREPLLPAAQSLIVAPMIGRRRVYGAVIVGSLEPDQWKESDSQTLMAVAGLLANVIEASEIGGGEMTEELTHQVRALIGHILVLQRTLRADDTLTPTQRELIIHMERLNIGLAQRLSGNVTPTANRLIP